LAAFLVLLGLIAATQTATADSYLTDYESGQRALRYGSWDEALFWFQLAAEARPQDGGPPARISGRNYVAYLPKYFVGLAYYMGGRYSEAMEAWAAAEEQWSTEPWLAQSAGLAEYRAKLASYRESYEKKLLPEADRRLDSYLQEVRAAIATLKDQQKLSAAAGAAAEIAAAENLLSAWSTRAVTAQVDYSEILSLTHKAVEVLGRLEALQACADPEKAQSWCRLAEPPASRIAPVALTNHTQRGLVIPPKDLPKINNLYQNKVALLISPSYTSWPKIPNAAAKLNTLRDALGKLGFKVQLLVGATNKSQLRTAIQGFMDQNAPQPADQPNLVWIHFLGHGHTILSGGRRFGVLVTSATPGPKADSRAIGKEVLFDGFFHEYLTKAPHHLVFTFETCSSGRFFEELLGPNPGDWRNSFSHPAFLVLTGGGADEVGFVRQLPLTDELTRALAGCGQGGRLATFTGYHLLLGVQKRISEEFPNRNPQFKKYQLDDYREGDILLNIPDHCSGGGMAKGFS
jgi:tetratricopeptide (TPR) repeat protein